MLRKFALIVAAGAAMFYSAAYALGLGEIDVDSHLNQKFSASIPLNSISPEDAENLLVRLADSDDFNKAGIERSDYLSSLTFKVVSDAKNSRIVISSKQLAREPFLSFLLDVRSSSGRVLREYTVLLDPPAYATQPAAAPAAPAAAIAKAPSDYYQTADEANQPKPAVTPAPVAPPAKPAAKPAPAAAASVPAPAMAAPVADAASDVASVAYGPVKAQETFWSIASKLRPDPSVTMDQMLWALYSANPQAFEGKSITGLLKGSTLKVPSLSDITAVSPAAAKEHLQQLQGHRATASKKAAPVVDAEEAPVAPAPKMEAHAAPKPANKPAVAEKKTPEPVAPPPAAAAPAKPAPAPAAKPATPAPAAAPAAPAAKAAVTAPPPPAPAPEAAPAPAAAPAATPTTEGTAPDAAPATPAAAPAEPDVQPALPPKPSKKSSASSSAPDDDFMMPVVAGAVVLILALLGVRFWQKRQAEKDNPAAPVLTSKASSNLQFWKRAAESAPAATATGKFAVPPPPVPAAKTSKPLVAKSILDVPPPPPKPSAPAWDDTVVQAAAPEQSFDLTQSLDRHSDATTSLFAQTGGVDEFNSTNQFDTDTVKVNTEANDPVSEADFHLAYGLYDEAALLLESAVEKNPGRTDIRVKLAETYFRANKPHEFDDVAQSLKPHLDAAEWQKVAIMGSQLLPDSPLYKGAGGATMADSVDLAFDEPIDLGAAETQIFSSTAARPAQPQPSAPSARSGSSVLDFKLEDLEAPQVSKPPPPAPSTKAADSNTLEFNLSDFDLSSPSAKPAAAPVEEAPTPVPAPAATTEKASNAVEFDLGGFDLEPAKPAAGAAALNEDINLDDFDLGELADDSHAISAGDEAGTKLDLARAYVDMGDNDMARSLLTEVLVQGSEEQKTEAQALIQRLA